MKIVWILGRHFISNPKNIIQVLPSSTNIFCFLIRNFLAYKWGMEAFMIAHDRMVNGRKDLLIVILKEKINVDRLPADLRVYISKY